MNEANTHAKQNGSPETTIDPEALEWIAQVSEGYPHFIQQYAFSAFEANTDNIIDMADVRVGAYKENGALDQLGISYFEDMYTVKIDSDDYRKVLQVMAENSETWMSRKEIGQKAGLKETTLSNALRALKDRQIVIANAEKSGFYKLPSNSFAVWIRAKAKRERERQSNKPSLF